MGFPCCDICDEPLSWTGPPHECDKETLRKHVNKLKDEARVAENKLDDMQNAVLMLLKELPSLEEDKIPVSGEWLRRLWDTTKNCWYEAKTADEFLVQWMVTHRILCEAYDVFRSTKYGHSQTLLQKLKDLREACDNSKEVLGYRDSHFDMSPEDLTKPLGQVTECDDCGIKTTDLITKSDHHGGMKTVCTDRNACHARGG